jgi:F0F1-type ATP synthase membrane subunit c/vacuolar-type H+-ATPase subunit K
VNTISAENVPIEAPRRTIGLRAALAVGVSAVAAAFGVGWIVADATVAPVAATASEPRTPASHTVDRALTDSLALKGRAAQSEISDIRKRRVE